MGWSGLERAALVPSPGCPGRIFSPLAVVQPAVGRGSSNPFSLSDLAFPFLLLAGEPGPCKEKMGVLSVEEPGTQKPPTPSSGEPPEVPRGCITEPDRLRRPWPS